jgi:hypothetical protein
VTFDYIILDLSDLFVALLFVESLRVYVER